MEFPDEISSEDYKDLAERILNKTIAKKVITVIEKDGEISAIKFSATYRDKKGRFQSAFVLEHIYGKQKKRAVYLLAFNMYVDSILPDSHKLDPNHPYNVTEDSLEIVKTFFRPIEK